MARGRSKRTPGLSRTLGMLGRATGLRPERKRRAVRLAHRRKRGSVTRALGSLVYFPQPWGGTRYGRRRRAKR